MARRTQPLETLHWFGVMAIALVVTLIGGTLVAVFWRAEAPATLAGPDWAAVRFTVLQAFLSALLSCLLAIPVARALARRNFPGRSAIITLLGAPFILPVIVAVLGLLAIFGRSGVLSDILGLFGLPPVHIYGLHGVLIAHVFLNLPLATRLLLQGWLAIPSERFRLAASLDFAPTEIAAILERPMLRAILPGTFMVIFLVCLTSFSVALTLGGGPAATTVELAIYQAFNFDFDLDRAALLGLVQLLLTVLAAVLALRFHVPSVMGAGLDRVTERWDARAKGLIALDTLILILVSAFLLLPLGAVALRGAGAIWSLQAGVWLAAGYSVVVALGSAFLSLAMALPVALFIERMRSRAGWLAETAGYLSIAASPLVIGTGLFILLQPFVHPPKLALYVVALVNAVMSLPFALRAILPALRDVEAGYGELADSLEITGWARLRLVLWPRMRGAIGFASGIAAAFSMGDLGVITLFNDPERTTLPMQLYGLMGAYRMEDAMGAALLLMGLSLALFWLFDRGGRGHVGS